MIKTIRVGVTAFAVALTAIVNAAEAPRVVEPAVTTTPGPLRPSQTPIIDQSVLLGHNWYFNGDARAPWYEPVEPGAFRIKGGKRKLHRWISAGAAQLWTGDLPLMQVRPGSGHSQSHVGAYWPQKNSKSLVTVYPILGTLRLGLVQQEGRPSWFDTFADIETTFWPGYTDYVIPLPSGGKAHVRAAPIPGTYSAVCRIRFEGPAQRLVWSFGGIGYNRAKPCPNQVAVDGNQVRITEPEELTNGVVLAGWDGVGSGRAVADEKFSTLAEFTAKEPQSLYHICVHWGVTQLDRKPFDAILDRLDKTPAATGWSRGVEPLKEIWKACYLEPVLNPEEKFKALASDSAGALDRAVAQWDSRRAEFVVNTPDKPFNALVNWLRCVSDYHRLAGGYVLSASDYPSYYHLSVGWYGKEWGGDHAANENNLRLYAVLQEEDRTSKYRHVGNNASTTPKGGNIGMADWRLQGLQNEANTTYWVDQVWQNYRWTGNKAFLKDMWPHVVKAVRWELLYGDPDGDGLFRSHYEYWNCDSGGKGPKSACPTATAYGMLTSAANIARELGENEAEREYRALADKSRAAAQRELWSEETGLLGSIEANGVRRLHPEHWEEYYGFQFGLLSPEQARRAMRWVESHYGFIGARPEVRLLMSCDWWPVRWSHHWVPLGDTVLAAMAGMKCGDTDLWWSYVQTAVQSAYRNDFPGVNLAISTAAASANYPDCVDAEDPPVQLAVRGVFGIEPDLHESRLSICPAFPSDWKEASIKTPDVSYEYQRDGDTATFQIHTPRPLVKRVKANLTGEEILTPAEQESVVKVKIGPALPEPTGPKPPRPILADRERAKAPTPLTAAQRARLVQLDLSKAYNTTQEEMTGRLLFVFDAMDEQDNRCITRWWYNPPLALEPMPREITAADGVSYLTAGRTTGSQPEKSLLALCSWKPYPLPGGAKIAIGRTCERVCMLLQCYTHPMKSYIPNGEVDFIYVDGKRDTVQLIPPFNLDCYYQVFSREGTHVPFGKPIVASGVIPRHSVETAAHALSLILPCDPARRLEAVELRATCSEAVIGLVGLSLVEAEVPPAR